MAKASGPVLLLGLAAACLGPFEVRLPAADGHQHLAEPVVLDEPLSIAALDAEAKERDPELQAARARWEAAKERSPQARAWEDPKAMVAFGHDLTMQPNDQSFQASLSQAIPWPGVTTRRLSAAESEAAAALAEWRQTECEVGARLRAAVARMADARAQLGLNTRVQKLLGQLIDSAQGRYESGQGNEADVLMAESEAAKNEEMRGDALRAYADAQAEIDTLLDRPPTSPLGRPPVLETPPEGPSLESLLAMAAEHSPTLAAAASRRDAARVRIGLAELEKKPRLEVSLAATQYNGPGPALQGYGAGLAVSLPWANGGRHRAAVAEARRNAEAQEADLKAVEADTAARVRESWQDFVTSRHHADLYAARLVPLARRASEAAEIAYEASRGSFGDVLVALRTEQELESSLFDHQAECRIALASLIPLTGGAVPGTDSRP